MGQCDAPAEEGQPQPHPSVVLQTGESAGAAIEDIGEVRVRPAGLLGGEPPAAPKQA